MVTAPASAGARESEARDTDASAPRTAPFTTPICGRTWQPLSSAQSCFPVSTQEVIAIGPSTASMMSARLIAAGGRDRRTPPPVPREDSSKPASDSRLTSFCAVGSGMPVSAESVVALTFARPQWRAAADIITTA